MNHSKGEYVTTGSFNHSNTVENFFSIFKRGVIGAYRNFISRFLAEKEKDIR